MLAIDQGVNTQEQVKLLEFIKQNNKNFRKIPTIILGNKMDDLIDEDIQNLSTSPFKNIYLVSYV